MSTKETLTIHRALSELKVIDSRIDKLIDESTFVMANKHSNTKINGKTVDEVKESIKSNYAKINDLIKRKVAIKKAVVLSNAKTLVKVNEVSYSVAEAIDMKNHGLESKEILLSYMERQLSKAKAAINLNNDKLSAAADNYVTGIFGGKDSKVDVKAVEDAKKAFMEANAFEMIDPINIEKEILSLNDEIDKFKAEVDAVLSESNAITVIEIEY